jgi:hypothetical protein
MIPEESNERSARIRVLQEKTERHIEHLGVALINLTEAHTRTQWSLRELAKQRRETQRAIDRMRGDSDASH